MTPQEQVVAKLAELQIPHKKIHCYGSQIMITCRGYESAQRFRSVLCKFCTTVRGPTEDRDYNKENLGTVLRPTKHRVFRVWGTI